MEAFGRYVLLRLAGEGGMAQVHLARQKGPGGFVKPCVLKRIAPDHLQDERMRKLFLEEARVSALLNHRNVVQTFDFGEVGGVPFMAMELVDGVNLAQLLRLMAKNDRWIALGPAVAVVRAVLEALEYAHQLEDLDGRPLKLVHRDVSPQNILLSRAGDVKLADFGIARHEARQEQTIGLQPKGKLGYMAPEQALGGPIDGRADLFSLGLVLVELISAQRVIEPGESIPTIESLPDRLRERCNGRDESPAELNAFALRLAAADVKARPRSAREAIELLDPIIPKLPPARPLPEFLKRIFDKYFPAGLAATNQTPSGASLPEVDPRENTWTTMREEATSADSSSIVYEGWPAEFAPEPANPPPLSLKPPEAQAPAPMMTPYEVVSRSSGVEAMKHFAPEISEEAKLRGKVEVDRAVAPLPAEEPPTKQIMPAVQLGLGALVIALFALGVAGVIAKRDPEAPVALKGDLRVSSAPNGAKIIIDGRATGEVTPTVIKGLPADVDFRVSVQLAGHRSVPRQATVKIPPNIGHTSAAFKLEKGRVFRMESEPEGAVVEVDGARQPDVTPLDLEPLPFGETARVTLKLPDHLPVELSLVADAATATVTRVKLEPAKEIDIVSMPEGAEITLDAKKLGATPVYDLAVPLNRKVTVIAKKQGFKTSRARVAVKRLEGRQLVINLEPLPLMQLPMSKAQRQQAKVLDAKLARIEARLRTKRKALEKAERNLKMIEATKGAFIADIADAQRSVDVTQIEIETLETEKSELAAEIEQFREELRSSHP